ncbi:MAG: iron-containing alcohol dehydrogenase [Ruminococcus sp.]|nr:iron-containing alcohol dehydrogenase [Ruminococcus sp.]
MNIFKKIFCRVYQSVFYLAMPLLPYREPELHKSLQDIPDYLKSQGVSSALLITDSYLYASGSAKQIAEILEEKGIGCAVYHDTRPNPTVKNVEEALKLYKEHNCQGIIAFGGGSPIDCAKAVGARVAYPKKHLNKLKGILRVMRKLPPLVAVPTTAGTGSEVTVAAVITDDEKKHKYTINSFPLIPHCAVHDPQVTVTLPQHLTSTTGMDALTHAIEAYIGRSTTKATRRMSLEAVRLIFENIEVAYNDGTNIKARENMLRASYLAGNAFSHSYVGYIHAVAHSLGGQYNIPHGLANSVLLPVVLEDYGKAVHKKLHKLAVAAGVATDSESASVAAEKFICAIRDMNSRMNIPQTLEGIREEDIPLMAKHADKEANPLYPVPVLMDAKQLRKFYYKVADWS